MLPVFRRIPLTSLAGAGVLLLIVGAAGWMQARRSRAAPPVPTPQPAEARAIEVYFTRPDEPGLRAGERALAALVDGMDAARLSIDVACYHINLEDLAAALLRARERGVLVRVVTDDAQAGESVLGGLERAGIEVRDDGSPALMHHKFVVIDGSEVWTGSMNLTSGSVFHDDNNLLRIRSDDVAADFGREFDEMYDDGLFGALSNADTPSPRVAVDGVDVEVYFSPDDGVARRLERLVGEAEESIDVMAFAFTADGLAEAMLERRQAGVRLRGVVERDQADSAGAEFLHLLEAGVDIRLDNSYGNLHHKVILIDGDTVVTGSYNFTRSAETANDEALLILRSPWLAAAFGEEFDRRFAGASPE